jgi:competence protein ComEC
VMWLGVLAGAAAQIALPLAAPFAALTAPPLVYLQAVAHLMAAMPASVVEIRAAPAVIVVVWVALLAAAVGGVRYAYARRARLSERLGDPGGATAGWRAHRRRLVAATAATILALLVVTGTIPGRGARAATPRAGELVVSFLDVGQGDATLIQLGGASVLVDTGPPDGPIVRRLEQARVKRLDALVLTHAEADHEGAAPAVIERYAPRLVIDGGAGWSSPVQRVLPTAVAAKGARQLTPRAGQSIAIGGLRFEVLWPPELRPGTKPSGNPNDRAVVARVEVGEFSMLLSADAESNVTAALELESVDVLKVAHHGSADPGLPALLKRLRPRVAAIEVGQGNTYGHPTQSTLKALRQVVPTVLRTDRDGTVRLHAIGDRVWVER